MSSPDLWDLPHEEIRTRKGRVVYWRRHHPFLATDLFRVARKFELPRNIKQIAAFFGAVAFLLSKLNPFLSIGIADLANVLEEHLRRGETEVEESEEDGAEPTGEARRPTAEEHIAPVFAGFGLPFDPSPPA